MAAQTIFSINFLGCFVMFRKVCSTDSEPYGAATMAGFALCRGAQNPLGVALYAECNIVGSTDEVAVAVSDRKSMDDNQWSPKLINILKKFQLYGILIS